MTYSTFKIAQYPSGFFLPQITNIVQDFSPTWSSRQEGYLLSFEMLRMVIGGTNRSAVLFPNRIQTTICYLSSWDVEDHDLGILARRVILIKFVIAIMGVSFYQILLHMNSFRWPLRKKMWFLFSIGCIPQSFDWWLCGTSKFSWVSLTSKCFHQTREIVR